MHQGFADDEDKQAAIVEADEQEQEEHEQEYDKEQEEQEHDEEEREADVTDKGRKSRLRPSVTCTHTPRAALLTLIPDIF